MAINWTYSDNPLTSPADELRFLVGDTQANDPLFSDNEVAYLLAKANGSPLVAALNALTALIAKSSRYVDETVGSISLSLSQRQTQFQAALDAVKARLAVSCGMRIYGGGQSYVAKQGYEMNPDRVPPRFRVHPTFETSSLYPEDSYLAPQQDSGQPIIP